MEDFGGDGTAISHWEKRILGVRNEKLFMYKDVCMYICVPACLSSVCLFMDLYTHM